MYLFSLCPSTQLVRNAGIITIAWESRYISISVFILIGHYYSGFTERRATELLAASQPADGCCGIMVSCLRICHSLLGSCWGSIWTHTLGLHINRKTRHSPGTWEFKSVSAFQSKSGWNLDLNLWFQMCQGASCQLLWMCNTSRSFLFTEFVL